MFLKHTNYGDEWDSGAKNKLWLHKLQLFINYIRNLPLNR